MKQMLILVMLTLSHIVNSQSCDAGFTINNTILSGGKVKHTQTATTLASRKEFFIYSDGNYSDYKYPTHQYMGGSANSATAYLLNGYDNDPKKRTVKPSPTNTGVYQDQFPAFDGSIFINTSWQHSVVNPNYVCNTPYYVVIINNCSGRDNVNGSLSFYYKNAQATVGTVISSYAQNPNWFQPQQIITSNFPTGFDKGIKYSFYNLKINERRAIYVPLTHNGLSLNAIVNTRADLTFDNAPICGSHEGGSSAFLLHNAQVMDYPHDPNFMETNMACFNNNYSYWPRIYYKINFQNTGLGSVQKIKIEDFFGNNINPATAEFVDLKSNLNLVSFNVQNDKAIINLKGDMPGAAQPNVNIEDTKGWVIVSACLYNPSAVAVNEEFCSTSNSAIYFDTQLPVWTPMVEVCRSSSCSFFPNSSAISTNTLEFPITGTYNTTAPLPIFCTSGYAASLRTRNTQEPINIYPNPFTDQIVLEGDQIAEGAEILLYNSFGQIVYRTKISNELSSQTVINTESFNKGVYFVNINSESGKTVMKMIKF